MTRDRALFAIALYLGRSCNIGRAEGCRTGARQATFDERAEAPRRVSQTESSDTTPNDGGTAG